MIPLPEHNFINSAFLIYNSVLCILLEEEIEHDIASKHTNETRIFQF